ncbi:MAG TPA: hypothetical protein VM096_02355 [Vicinamibacterales bacterium]|nr:hypothetical protein [Vicinamibacterales bacterium]
MARDPNRKRGRPQKFGRAAQLISLTLPADVITWLSTIDEDMGWAIVKMHERATKPRASDAAVAQLVRFPGDRALILVRAELFKDMPGVSLIPLADGRAFLAMETGKGVADLELFVIDRIDDRKVAAAERAAWNTLRVLLKQWRQDGVRFESRSIVIARYKKGSPR